MEAQVPKNHYRFENYGHVGRFVSYQHQLREILKQNPASVLEIGVGDGVVKHYLKETTSIAYTSVDIATDLHPDIVASLPHLPLENDSYDVVCAFEVLEHLPFDQFLPSLLEMARVAKKAVIISVPHFGPPIKFLLKIPFLPEIRWAWKVPYHPAHTFNGEHYWEIGKKGYTLQMIRKTLESAFSVEREWVPFENQYHHFFVLTPKSISTPKS